MKKEKTKSKKTGVINARTPEGVEGQLISLAVNLAAKKLRDGTASSQLITHFLKLATERERLENERLRTELKVSEAKIKHMEAQDTSKELYEEAIRAFRSYSGKQSDEDEDEYD